MRFALTLDDAPTVVEPGLPALPATMDRIREVLQESHVAHCIAFVVGERAAGHEDILVRWLEAGYELGNHTYFHRQASRAGVSDTISSITKCDTLLNDLGAFPTGNKWFRFPYLDRGKDPAARAQIQEACEAMGYQLASATLSFHDHRFELPWQIAVTERQREAVISRYVRSVSRGLRCAQSRTESREMPTAQIGYAHFGPVTEAAITRLLRLLRSEGCCFCPMDEVVNDNIYKEYCSNFERNGLVLDTTASRSLILRAESRIARWTENRGWFEQTKRGPIWPYLR